MFDWLRRTPPAPTEQQRQLALALAEYPPYAPPEWNPDTKSFQDASAEYREYFFNSRQVRLDALRVFLAKFDIVSNVDRRRAYGRIHLDAGIRRLAAPRFGRRFCRGCLSWL